MDKPKIVTYKMKSNQKQLQNGNATVFDCIFKLQLKMIAKVSAMGYYDN